MNTPAPREQQLATALKHSEPLQGLLQRVRASQARLSALNDSLPAGLRTEIRAGPLDDAAWVVLVSHAAAAAKLRQLLPALEATLTSRGFPPLPIRVKVLPRG